MEQLGRVINYDGACILLPDGEDLVISRATGFANTYLGCRTSLTGKDAAVKVFRDKHSIAIVDTHQDPRWRVWNEDDAIRSWMGASLLIGDEPIGVLTVDSFLVGAYTEDDVQVMEIFAAQAARAIENSKLYHLEQKRRRLSDTLRKVAGIVSGTLESEKVVGLILDHLELVVEYGRASVMLLVDDQLTLIDMRNKMGHAVDSFTIPVNKYPLNMIALQSKQPILIPDVREDDRWHSVKNDTNAPRSLIIVPLLAQDHPIGLLIVSRTDEIPYTEDDTQTVFAFAMQVAIALENARLMEQTQLVNEELARLNADKDKFFSIVAHDLRGPFLPLLGNAELLSEMADGFTVEDIKDVSGSIYRSAKRVFNLLDDLLRWANIQMGRIVCEPQQLDTSFVINHAIEPLIEVAKAKQIALQNMVEPGILVFADQNMLNTIIRNLVNNALKFTSKEGSITITAQSNGKQVQISIVDTGVGISEENLQKLFKIGEHHSTVGTAKEAGTGLGLIMCREMVEMNGGRIGVKSEEGVGSEFYFTIPVVSN
jgi:signal transduction histidine kinase